MKKIISILGSTGSIGLTSLDIISKRKKSFKINFLCANKNKKLIIQQIKKFKPKYFVINNYSVYLKLKKKKFKYCKILNSFNHKELKKKNDILISAIPGISGLEPTIHFLRFTKKILIANKESIVCGWDIIKKKAKKYNTKIIPIDSEHFSLSKLLIKHKIKNIKKFYITASGGPFLNYKIEDFYRIKPKDALKHPKWKMGKKISIDSSTLMNKILELIEAQKLFNIPNNKIDIVIHPESLVHAIIELKNGLTEFVYHETSMVIPIANALFDENLIIDDFYRKNSDFFGKNLTFKRVNQKKFPVVKLKNLIDSLPSLPIIINASNELAVEQFIKGKIPFLGISKIIMSILKDRNFRRNAIKRPRNLDQIIRIDMWSREKTYSIINKYYV